MSNESEAGLRPDPRDDFDAKARELMDSECPHGRADEIPCALCLAAALRRVADAAKPSPYVNLYVTRKQADAMAIALECGLAYGLPSGRTRDVRAALVRLRKALGLEKPAAAPQK